MIAHLQSPVTRCRLTTYDEGECPDGTEWDVLHERLQAKVRICTTFLRKTQDENDIRLTSAFLFKAELFKFLQERYLLPTDEYFVFDKTRVSIH